MRTHPRNASTYGIDIGKTVYHVVGTDADGRPIQRAKFSRTTIFEFFANAPKALIGMEACPGSQWLARKLIALGHEVRILPAQFVKPYVKSNKNDNVDAEAIAEAVRRPTMRFVKVRRTDQIDMQALHRVRDQLVYGRTRLISQMRAFLLEYGIPVRNGAGAFKANLPTILGDESNDLTPAMRRILADMRADLSAMEERIALVTNEIKALGARDDQIRRLMTIPGVGCLGATALVAAVGDGKQFKKARDMAAWLGLVPAQYSTGGKSKLLGISKRGNPYIRRLLIHGARTCVIHLDRNRDRLGAWLDSLGARLHPNQVTVALANKIARVAWCILTRPGATYERRDPRFV
ncbi:MAG: IS110 family transposase [Burkholderiaceae bacterium]